VKILFDHPNPFVLAHGGFQIQIEQTKQALEQCGVDVEWLRWWDDNQRGEIVHYFGRPSRWYVQAAQRAGMKVIVAELLTGLGSRGAAARKVQSIVIDFLRRSSLFDRMGWHSFRSADACIAQTPWEASLMQAVFRAPAERVHVVPNGVEDDFLSDSYSERGKWLVCTATITERKRVLELAQAAVEARTPVWIVGRPYSDQDKYGQAFMEFARENSQYVRYEGPIKDRKVLARVYREARGFVLLSTMETLSLSSFEAAACGCPLLLSDLPWATTTFRGGAQFVRKGFEVEALRKFYAESPALPPPPKPESWLQIGRRYSSVYMQVLNSR